MRVHRLSAQPPSFRCQSQVHLVTCASDSWKRRYKLEVPLGLINVLEQLTEFRAAFYLLDYWCITKGYNSETARWKRYTGQGMWEGRQGFHAFCRHTALPRSPFEHQSGSSPNPVILGFYIEVFLPYRGLLHRWPLVIDLDLQPFSPLWRSRHESESSQPSSHLVRCPSNEPSPLAA